MLLCKSRVGQSSAPPVQSPFNIERPKRDRIDPNIGDKMMTVTGRIWTYVRDDRPFGGRAAGGPLGTTYYEAGGSE
jgi:hypothetical protein